LYLYSNDTTDWPTIDTTGFDWTLNRMMNTDTSWEVGAFERIAPVSAFDLGWGTYNSITHHINGDRLYVIKLADLSYRKLYIESLVSGVYTIRYANLDGKNTVTNTITKTDYTDKNFGYYSLENNTVIDREPLSSDWDFLFTRYITDIAPNTPFNVTGVLSNHNIKVAQVNNVSDVNTVTHLGQAYNSEINIVGWDWKVFDLNTFQFNIDDSLVYFVEDQDAAIYRLIFTGFTGTSAGEYHLSRELITSVGIEDVVQQNTILNAYPNPATNRITVIFNALSDNTVISIINLTGQEVTRKQINTTKGLSEESIDLSSLARGSYFLQVKSDNNNSVQRIVIQ